VEAARTIDIRVLDHIIVGKEGYCSFRERHLLPAMQEERIVKGELKIP
jgi:hypothetical protein